MDAKELKKYLKDSDLDVQNANAALFLADYVFGFYANSHKLYGTDFSPVCSYFSYSKLSAYYQIINKKSIVDLSEKIYKDFKRDKKSFDRKIKAHQLLMKKFDLTWKEYQKAKKRGLDDKVLYEFYEKFENISRSYWYNAIAGEDKGAIIEREIIPSFAERNNISIEKAQNRLMALAHPNEQSVFNLERKEFLQICLLIFQKRMTGKAEGDVAVKVLGDNELKNKIDSYLRRYFWIKTDFYRAKEITRESLIEEVVLTVKKKSKNEIEKEIFSTDKNFERINSEKKKIAKNSRLTREDRVEIYFSGKTIYWIDQRKLGMMKSIYYIFNLLNDIADYYYMDYANIILYSSKELKDLLAFNKKLDKKILAKRNDDTFILWERGKMTEFFYGKIAREMIAIAINVKKRELRGVVASKGGGGIIRGKVKIVLNPKEISFHASEILVTSMTRIEFVPLMRKALAIITNEGGLACHAAIISRELGLPAIIGTKNATNVLKNGDEIEMDMRTGEIKIIK